MVRPFTVRALTAGERRLAEEAIGPGLAVDRVRLLATPWPLVRAFVPGRWFGRDWIVWPRGQWVGDVVSAPLRLQALLVHELVHVWQAQAGINLLTGKLKAGDRPASYAYPLDDDCVWEGLNIEQQAMVVEHRFRLSRGAAVPADQAFYDRVCPLGRRPAD